MTLWQFVPVMIAVLIIPGVVNLAVYLRRPPRKRRPSKVAARVRDLGHRLAVVPAGASS